MSASAASVEAKQVASGLALWALIALYAVARVLQVFPGKVPALAVVALHVLPPAAFALIHGAMRYRIRGILVFFAICLVVGNLVENLGQTTGFPFGPYHFTYVMGPKLFHVPILLGLAYVGMGYLAWTLASVILGAAQGPLNGSRVVTVPLLSGIIMLAWDFSMDPVWSTLEHAWIWMRGGAYFGVPVSNFLGWYLTVYIIYQLFAFYLRDRPNFDPLPSTYWRSAVLFYGISAAGNLLLTIPRSGPSWVSDPAGVYWKVNVIIEVCALNSTFIMGAFAVLAWVKLPDQRATAIPRETIFKS
jgi:uncharacterized membrane protein